MKSTTVAFGVFAFAIFTAASAPPAVAVESLENSCSTYPSNSNWTVVAESTGSALDSIRIGAEFFTTDGKDRFGFLTVPKRPQRLNGSPNITLRCTSTSTLQFSRTTDPTTWYDLFIAAEENWQSSLGFGAYLSPSIPVEPYAHYINGTRQPGVYIGAQNRTSWNFKFNWGGNAGEYYLLRLREKESAVVRRGDVEAEKRQFPEIDDRDYVGFLRVVG